MEPSRKRVEVILKGHKETVNCAAIISKKMLIVSGSALFDDTSVEFKEKVGSPLEEVSESLKLNDNF